VVTVKVLNLNPGRHKFDCDNESDNVYDIYTCIKCGHTFKVNAIGTTYYLCEAAFLGCSVSDWAYVPMWRFAKV
jgi:hypothetical protein